MDFWYPSGSPKEINQMTFNLTDRATLDSGTAAAERCVAGVERVSSEGWDD